MGEISDPHPDPSGTGWVSGPCRVCDAGAWPPEVWGKGLIAAVWGPAGRGGEGSGAAGVPGLAGQGRLAVAAWGSARAGADGGVPGLAVQGRCSSGPAARSLCPSRQAGEERRGQRQRLDVHGGGGAGEPGNRAVSLMRIDVRRA